MRTQFSVFVYLCSLVHVAYAEETAPDSERPTTLRLLNTEIFGKPATESVVLLQSPTPDAVDPETVMVDLSNGKYFAATVNYPLDIGFENARRSLNATYGKWQKDSFANDPAMGIWRNEDEELSIQLSRDDFTITIIYIKYALVTEHKLNESFSRVEIIKNDEAKARKAIGTMHALLSRQDFATFYSLQCHPLLQKEIDAAEFVAFMKSDSGQEVVRVVEAINAEIENDEKQGTFLSRFNPRDMWEYEFVLVPDKQAAPTTPRRRIKLRKENSSWKLRSYN